MKISKPQKTTEKPNEKNTPPPIEHFYELNEFTNEIPTIIVIIKKIKAELEITQFSEVTEKLSSALEKISDKNDNFSKLLIFSEYLSNSTKPNDNIVQ